MWIRVNPAAILEGQWLAEQLKTSAPGPAAWVLTSAVLAVVFMTKFLELFQPQFDHL